MDGPAGVERCMHAHSQSLNDPATACKCSCAWVLSWHLAAWHLEELKQRGTDQSTLISKVTRVPLPHFLAGTWTSQLSRLPRTPGWARSCRARPLHTATGLCQEKVCTQNCAYADCQHCTHGSCNRLDRDILHMGTASMSQ